MVYDVTKYLNDHPGGPEIMMEFAGKDSHHNYRNYLFGLIVLESEISLSFLAVSMSLIHLCVLLYWFS